MFDVGRLSDLGRAGGGDATSGREGAAASVPAHLIERSQRRYVTQAAVDVADMTPEGYAVSTIAEIDLRVQELSGALSAGRRPARDEAERLRVDVNCLARSEAVIAPWRMAELHADVQEIVRRALSPAPPPIEVPAQRNAGRRTRRRTCPRWSR